MQRYCRSVRAHEVIRLFKKISLLQTWVLAKRLWHKLISGTRYRTDSNGHPPQGSDCKEVRHP